MAAPKPEQLERVSDALGRLGVTRARYEDAKRDYRRTLEDARAEMRADNQERE